MSRDERDTDVSGASAAPDAEAGDQDAVSRVDHDAAITAWRIRFEREEETLSRVVAANEQLQENLRAAQARIRSLRSRNRRLRERLADAEFVSDPPPDESTD